MHSLFPSFYRRCRLVLRRVGRGWRRLHWLWRGVMGLLLVGLCVRGAAYLVPIRAADLVQVNQAVEFRDRHNQPLGTLLSLDQEHTSVVPLDQVSPQFQQAILAAEDGDFYQHGAVSWRAIARASLHAVQARRIVSGGSTITMQLARMVHPVPRTLAGKGQQIWDAWRLAAGMNKAAILAAYVNRLPMGGNIYGVEAGARVYFGVSARDLTLAQASLLAALPNAPTALDPYNHWEALKQRQRYVLDRMVAEGYLTAPQADRVQAQPVTLQLPEQQLPTAPHFLFWLSDRLPPDHPAQIQTSLDRNLQRFVEAQVQQAIRGLAEHQVQQAAAIVIANATGEVLAYVGSPAYFGPPTAGQNDGVQALRQPGSTLKPFLYELALEQGVIQPTTILQDVPTHYAIPGAQLYSPTDYSETFQGPVRVRAALANSLNIPAVRVLAQVGVPTFLDRLQALGFTHLTQDADYYGLGLALGSGEVTLWELAQAYLTLAHQGDPTVRLTPWRGHTIPLPAMTDAPQTLAAQPQTQPLWALITDMLADAHARAAAFGVDSVLNLPFPAAVKTGTSSDYRDTWTVGFTTDYTVATWVGNFDGAPMRQVSGVTGAAPLWHRILVHLHETKEPGRFAPPAGMVQRPICATTGQAPTPTCEAVVQEYVAPGSWAIASASPPSVATTTAPAAALRILAPTPDSRFLWFPPTADQTDQRLQFAIAPPADSTHPILWTLNGEPLAADDQTTVFWPLQPGRWTLAVQQGDRRDQVNFVVEQAAEQPVRPGFSVRSSP